MTVIIDGTTGIQSPDGSGTAPSYSNDGDGNTGVFFPAADTVAISTAGSERARVDSAGNMGLGVTPSAWAGGAGFDLPTFSGISGTTALGFAASFNAYWNGSTWKYKASAAARAFVMDSASHIWLTAGSGTAGNDISFTQTMTLDASGNLLVGQTNGGFNSAGLPLVVGSGSGNTGITIFSGSASSGSLHFADAATTGNDSFRGYINYSHSTNSMQFGTDAAERARITSGGVFLVGKTASAATSVGFEVDGTGALYTTKSTSTNADATYYLYSTGAAAYRFYVGMAGTVFATNTTISAISDQRLKENVRDLDVGLDAVMALKPRKFDWKEGKGKDRKDDRGFIAQEFEQVFPDLVDEWKDPAPEGEEPYKSVRQDLIPVLVKAIQELKAELDATKAEVAALKGAN